MTARRRHGLSAGAALRFNDYELTLPRGMARINYGGKPMPGTIKIWWHDGSTRDARYQPTPLINEPEIAYEEMTVGGSAVSSGAAPEEAYVAVIESQIPVRYRILPVGSGEDATSPRAKPMLSTSFATATIGVQPGFRISFIEETNT
ncbi:MAG: hypothetical protein AAGH74_08560 [Pseudomonadota bacterium]